MLTSRPFPAVVRALGGCGSETQSRNGARRSGPPIRIIRSMPLAAATTCVRRSHCGDAGYNVPSRLGSPVCGPDQRVVTWSHFQLAGRCFQHDVRGCCIAIRSCSMLLLQSPSKPMRNSQHGITLLLLVSLLLLPTPGSAGGVPKPLCAFPPAPAAPPHPRATYTSASHAARTSREPHATRLAAHNTPSCLKCRHAGS